MNTAQPISPHGATLRNHTPQRWFHRAIRLLSSATLIASTACGTIARSDEFPSLKLQFLPNGQPEITIPGDSGVTTNYAVETTSSLDFLPFWTPWDPAQSSMASASAYFRLRLSDAVLAGQDSDGDGIDDLYEYRHPQFLNPNDPADAGKDWDGDGRSNLEEYRAGTDPDDFGGRLVHFKFTDAGTQAYVETYYAINSEGRLWKWTSRDNTDPATSIRSEPLPGQTWSRLATSGESSASHRWTAAEIHFLAVASDGRLWSWGSNGSGELGIGSTNDVQAATQVGSDTDWAQCVAGHLDYLTNPLLPQFTPAAGFSAALKRDGSLWQWGMLTAEDMDTNGSPRWTAPHQVDAPGQWASIQLFRGASLLGLKRDGSLWIWGFNASYSLGTNISTLEQIAVPRRFGGASDWARVQASHGADSETILAIKRDGTLWTWNAGAIGLPEGPDLSKDPIEIGNGWRWRAAEYYRSDDVAMRIDAIREDGTLWSWGHLIGLALDNWVPQPILVDASTRWLSLNEGLGRSVSGRLWKIGGANPATGVDRPVLSKPWRIGRDTDWTRISAGINNSTGLKAGGSLWHWGRLPINLSGVYPQDVLTVSNIVPGLEWKDISLSRHPTFSENMFGVSASGEGMLWGYPLVYWGGGVVPIGAIGGGDPSYGGSYEYVPRQSPIPGQLPVSYGGTNTGWQTILRGADHGLGLKTDGTVWSWGLFPRPERDATQSRDRVWLALSNSPASRQAANTPVQILTPNAWVSIAAGADHDLLLASDGSLFAFGYNDSGELGLGDGVSRTQPARVGQAGEWATMAAGDYHSLAVKKDGTLWAWGANDQGQLGSPGAGAFTMSPVQAGNGNSWQSVFAGPASSYALDRAGHLWAWGANTSGQLGVGDTLPHPEPATVAYPRAWKAISAGMSHTLGIAQDGSLWGWGNCFLGGVPDNNEVPPVLYPISQANDW